MALHRTVTIVAGLLTFAGCVTVSEQVRRAEGDRDQAKATFVEKANGLDVKHAKELAALEAKQIAERAALVRAFHDDIAQSSQTASVARAKLYQDYVAFIAKGQVRLNGLREALERSERAAADGVPPHAQLKLKRAVSLHDEVEASLGEAAECTVSNWESYKRATELKLDAAEQAVSEAAQALPFASR